MVTLEEEKPANNDMMMTQEEQEARHVIALAVDFLSVTMDRGLWGEAWLEYVQRPAPRTWSVGGMRPRTPKRLQASMLRLMRGLAILTKDPLDQAGFQDLSDALDGADLVSVDLLQATDKIDCFVLMTACFLVLRQPPGAIASIVTQMQLLLAGDKTLQGSLHNLDQSLNHPTPKKALWREDKTLLDSLFTAVCGAVTVCELLAPKTDDQLAATFQQMWVPLLPLTHTNDPTTDHWQSLRIHKMARHESWAAAVAVPGIVLAPIEPVLGFLAVGWSIGSLSVGTGLAIWTKALYEFDSFHNFYVWRHAIQRLLQGQSQCGQQSSVTLGSEPDEVTDNAVLVAAPSQVSVDTSSDSVVVP